MVDWNIIWDRPYTNYEKHHQVFWNLIKEKSFGKVLDLGCGSSSCWRDTNFDLTGIDTSESAIRESDHNIRGRFMVADIETFRMNEYFDTVVVSGVVNYFQNLSKIKKTIISFKPSTILITINVIDDFPDRHWDLKRINEEFKELGQINATFHEKIGWFIDISCGISYN